MSPQSEAGFGDGRRDDRLDGGFDDPYGDADPDSYDEGDLNRYGRHSLSAPPTTHTRFHMDPRQEPASPEPADPTRPSDQSWYADPTASPEQHLWGGPFGIRGADRSALNTQVSGPDGLRQNGSDVDRNGYEVDDTVRYGPDPYTDQGRFAGDSAEDNDAGWLGATSVGPDGISPEDRERYGIGVDDENVDDDIARESSVTRNLLEWAVVLVGAVLVALLLRAVLFQAFWIPSESMETTLAVDDRVLVNKLSYRLNDINRGDVVVFARPDDEPGEIRDLIKRVIGLPGETIEGRDNSVYVNGQRLVEPYLEEGVFIENFGPTVVPAGEVFVMGDNRDESYDSRRFGTVDEDRVVGRAFVLFWPLNRAGWL